MTKANLTDSEAVMLKQRIDSVQTRSEKTHEAARFLFFYCNHYPSAALVRSHTQTGSLSDISEDLKAFWQSVRDSGRSALKAPIPATLLEHFGKQLEDLWNLASKQASAAFDDERQSFVDEMKLAAQAHDETKYANQALAEELALVRKERDDLSQSNQELNGQLNALTSQVQVWQEKTSKLEEQLQQAQTNFSLDLARLADEREKERTGLKDQHRFALLQIDASRATERDLREQLKYLKETQDGLVQSYRMKASKADQALSEAQTEIRILDERIKNLMGQGVSKKPRTANMRLSKISLKKRRVSS